MQVWLVHHRMLQLPVVCPIKRDAIHMMEVFNQRFGSESGYVEDVEINFALPMAGQITLGRGGGEKGKIL